MIFSALQIVLHSAVNHWLLRWVVMLGGGCELALMCDFIYYCRQCKIWLTWSNFRCIAGIRWHTAFNANIGKAKAMEMCLTARQMGAQEAEQSGLVARIFPKKNYLDKRFWLREKLLKNHWLQSWWLRNQLIVHLKWVWLKACVLSAVYSILFCRQWPERIVTSICREASGKSLRISKIELWIA